MESGSGKSRTRSNSPRFFASHAGSRSSLTCPVFRENTSSNLAPRNFACRIRRLVQTRCIWAPRAVDRIEKISKLEDNESLDNEFVITEKKPGNHLTGLQRPWRSVQKTAGLDDVRPHAFRHSFASWGLVVGEGLPMISMPLGHSHGQTTVRHAHLVSDPIKSDADRIAEGILISAAARDF